MTEKTDFVLADHGSILTLTPLTDAAREWCEDHLQDGPTWGRGRAIEPRYWPDIECGIADAGLSIA